MLKVLYVIRCGFELEACIKDHNLDAFRSAIRAHARCGSDCSIHTDDMGDEAVELRTAPYTVKKAFKNLKSLCDVIRKYGYTNASCGLHFNFSTTSMRQAKYHNPYMFASNPIWMRLLREYRRTNNCYCAHRLKEDSPVFQQMVDQLYTHKDDGHYCSVNYEHFTGRKNQRIEVRVFGNKNYECKYKNIRKECDVILKLFDKCSRKQMKRKYFKKHEKKFNISQFVRKVLSK
jgi:hypothetical protein